jgi:hypothetical protein
VEDWLAGDTRGLGCLRVNRQSIGVIPTSTIELKLTEVKGSSSTA